MKKKPEEQSGGAPEWMVTFSDAMTLLMVFFILLFSMSTVDEQKETELSGAFNEVFNGGGSNPIIGEGVGDNTLMNSPNTAEQEQEEEEEQIGSLLEVLNGIINDKNLGDYIHVQKVERGVSVILVDSLLFESARADLKSESREILMEIATVLNEVDNQIIIEGHTDNLPINTYMFASNWELSTARAVVVTRFLVEYAGVNPTRISAQGYGEYRPMVLNDTAEGKAKNRRVNILILNKSEG